MQKEVFLKVWKFTNQLVRSEMYRHGRLHSKIEWVSKLDTATTPEDLIQEFVLEVMDDRFEEKDYVNLRTEIGWDTNDFYLRRKVSFAFKTFINNKIKVLRNRKKIEANLTAEDIMSTTLPNGERNAMNKQALEQLTRNEVIILSWRLREITTEEALTLTGYKGTPSLYKVLDDVRAKMFGRPVLSKSNSKQRQADMKEALQNQK